MLMRTSKGRAANWQFYSCLYLYWFAVALIGSIKLTILFPARENYSPRVYVTRQVQENLIHPDADELCALVFGSLRQRFPFVHSSRKSSLRVVETRAGCGRGFRSAETFPMAHVQRDTLGGWRESLSTLISESADIKRSPRCTVSLSRGISANFFFEYTFRK